MNGGPTKAAATAAAAPRGYAPMAPLQQPYGHAPSRGSYSAFPHGAAAASAAARSSASSSSHPTRRHLYPSGSGGGPPPQSLFPPSTAPASSHPSYRPPYFRRVSDVGRPGGDDAPPSHYGGDAPPAVLSSDAAAPYYHPSTQAGAPYRPPYHPHHHPKVLPPQQLPHSHHHPSGPPRRGYAVVPPPQTEYDYDTHRPQQSALAPPTLHHQHHPYGAASYAVSRRLPRAPPSQPAMGVAATQLASQPPATAHDRPTRAGTATAEALPNKVTTEKKTKSLAHALLSPTTMTFERILECASLISSASKRAEPIDKHRDRRGASEGVHEDKENVSLDPPPVLTLSPAPGAPKANAAGCRPVPPPPTPPPRSTKRQISLPLEQEPTLAKRPLSLRPVPVREPDVVMEDGPDPFEEIERDPALYNKVVIKMALQRQVYDEPKIPDFTVPTTIAHGFFWRDYPPLEQILFDNMGDYYMVSAGQRQSKLQQNFNNKLVSKIRQVAEDNGWTFDKDFGDKKIRDRVRCFYKTHLQNAKKRLTTLQKNSHSAEHKTALRVYLRSAQLNISIEESQALEPQALRRRFQRATASTKAGSGLGSTGESFGGCSERGEIFADLQKTHLGKEPTGKAVPAGEGTATQSSNAEADSSQSDAMTL